MTVTIDQAYMLRAGGLTVQLRPGAALLYRTPWVWRPPTALLDALVGKAIQIKTWDETNHIEVLTTPGHAVSARVNGVHNFAIETRHLYEVWVPRERFDLDAAMAWFFGKRPDGGSNADGQGYDWFGLFRFFTLGEQSLDRQFCSEVCTRLYRAGGVEPFTKRLDADLVPPAMYRRTGAFDCRVEASTLGW